MKRYKIGYYSYEESHYVELEHEETFTKEKLTDIIADCVLDVIPKMKKGNHFLHNFQDVFTGNYKDISVIKLLVENKGFKFVEYEKKWDCFGWGSLFKNDWECDSDDNLKKLRKKVEEKGFTSKEYDSMEQEDDL